MFYFWNVVFNTFPTEMKKERAFQYGKNIGISYQLIDDLLDFTSTAEMLGGLSSSALITDLLIFPLQESLVSQT